MPSSQNLPTVGTRTTLDSGIKNFLAKESGLHLGGAGDFHEERAHHTKVFGFHALPKDKPVGIHEVEFTAIRGPNGTIPIRVFYPSSGEERRKNGDAGALIYFHGGGYTVGTVDEFENGLRIVAERGGVQVYAVEYRLAPEWRYPTQPDEYLAVIEWLQGEGGKKRGVSSERVMGGGDSAGGNMTAAVSLRLRDEKKKPLAAQILLYPEARLPFDTKSAVENNSGLYLECRQRHFLIRESLLAQGSPPSHPYISPGMQPIESLRGVPPAAIFTCGFDPLRDVGVEYGTKSKQASNEVTWYHFDTLTHGFLQFSAWSREAMNATEKVGDESKRLAYKI
ncbi:hypothetical protein DL98DRAFT_615131 [Cadophora sp. DSE1049]|nr:hypothetical protein DL98DRAFT_615131 [Cadophora sp. DSE1049]